MTISTRLIIEFPAAPARDAASVRETVAATREAAAAVADAGFGALLLPDAGYTSSPHLDPGILAGLLSADAATAAPLIISAGTSRNAPYNLARRLQTLNRITGGRVGLLLRGTGLDSVTASAGALSADAASGQNLLGEYLEVLARLWTSFPEDTLLGDREAGLLADTGKVVPASFRGDIYSVAGALNVPLPPSQRPLLLAEAGAVAADAFVDALVGADTDFAAIPRFQPWTWLPEGAAVLSGAGAPHGSDDGRAVAGPAARLAGVLQEAASTTTAGWLLRVPVAAGRLAGHLRELSEALVPADSDDRGSGPTGGVPLRAWLAGLAQETSTEHYESRDLQAHAR